VSVEREFRCHVTVLPGLPRTELVRAASSMDALRVTLGRASDALESAGARGLVVSVFVDGKAAEAWERIKAVPFRAPLSTLPEIREGGAR